MDDRERIPMTDSDRKENQPYDIDVIPKPVHQTKSAQLANRVIAVFLIVIALGLGIFLKWSFANTDILTINNSPFPARVVADPSGKTGGIVFLKANYCKNVAVDGQLRLSYISASREVFLPVVKEQSPKGCDDKEIPVVIPLNLLKDSYKVKFHVTYDVNPLKTGITNDFESQPITVGSNIPN